MKSKRTNMMFGILIFILGMSIVEASSVVNRNDIAIQNLKFYIEGQEFWIKAVSYEPVPLGRQDMVGEANGTGLCSPLQTPFGNLTHPIPEFKSACYDSDYFDGGSHPERDPPGPTGGWFNKIWQRDLPVIQSLGVNTLRLYNANPTTLQASIEQQNITEGYVYPYGKNHIPFFDYAEAHNLKIIFPLIGDKWLLLNTDETLYKRFLMNQIDEIGNHSALCMYMLGNELGLQLPGDNEGWTDQLQNIVNNYINFARDYQLRRWGRFIPMTSAVVDYPSLYESQAAGMDVDVFTTNAGYRGLGFSGLWEGDNTFPGWLTLSCQYNKPVFIGEWGYESTNNQINYAQPNWFNQKYSALVEKIDMGCIGGSFFEFNDEPMKTAANQRTMGMVNYTQTVCSRTQDCWEPEPLVFKDNIFVSVYSGMWNGRPFNYNTSVFDLISRPQTSLTSSTWPALCPVGPPQTTSSFRPRDSSTSASTSTST
eukprot:TRINITY_DN2594_c0_g2_i1.p2 TRINITY_DN2594_c0_g2~~TRINITY_DN2594_c0_g2_i1.p2  ORF type:complete len:480 (-),score=117.42 TRINITY_DN2594_c0_g2_i1:2849-4288(-)